MKYHIPILFLIASISSCKKENNCKDIYQNYISLRIKSDNDQALNSLNKAIKCDTENEHFRFEKVTYLIFLERYNEAIKELTSLEKMNKSYEEMPLIGLLEIRIGNKKKGLLELRKVRDNLHKQKRNDFNLKYYRTLLDLLFEDRDSVLQKVQKENFATNDNERAITNYLESLIKSDMDSLNILYDAFKIK